MIPEINHPVSLGPKHPSKQNIVNTLLPASRLKQSFPVLKGNILKLFEFMQNNKYSGQNWIYQYVNLSTVHVANT